MLYIMNLSNIEFLQKMKQTVADAYILGMCNTIRQPNKSNYP